MLTYCAPLDVLAVAEAEAIAFSAEAEAIAFSTEAEASTEAVGLAAEAEAIAFKPLAEDEPASLGAFSTETEATILGAETVAFGVSAASGGELFEVVVILVELLSESVRHLLF